MGLMQFAAVILIVLGISCSAKRLYNGSSGGLGNLHYGYRYPYYRGSASTVSYGSQYPSYSGWGYNHGKWEQGLGLTNDPRHYRAYYPSENYGLGGYSHHYPYSTTSQTINRPKGSTFGGIYRGYGAQVFQSPVRYHGYSVGNPTVLTYGFLYPRKGIYFHNFQHGGQGGLGGFVSSYPTEASANTVSHGISHPSMHRSWGFRFPAGQSVSTVQPTLDYRGLGIGDFYRGYSINYPVGAAASTLSHGVSQPIGLGFGNSYSRYSSHYPAATSVSHTTQRAPHLGGWSGYGQGYGIHYPIGASLSTVSQEIGQPLGYRTWGHGHGTHYPVGHSLSTVSQGIQHPLVYGGWGLTGGYGTDYPSGSSRSVSHGFQSPVVGGFGLRGQVGGYGLGGFVGGYGRPGQVRGSGLGGLVRGSDLGGLVGGFGLPGQVGGSGLGGFGLGGQVGRSSLGGLVGGYGLGGQVGGSNFGRLLGGHGIGDQVRGYSLGGLFGGYGIQIPDNSVFHHPVTLGFGL